MALLLISFIAGLLTVLAPCILPLLPVVVGSSAAARNKLTPFVVVASLAVSVILFTYLLKVSTAFINIPPYVWTLISGGILTLFGLTLLFPGVWERIPGMARMSQQGNLLVGKGYQRKSLFGDILIGAALGPVFSSCSPTYFVILASVLPASFALGTLYLFAYVIGLSISLLAIALLGQRFADRLSGIADPKSWAKRAIGVLFIILGLAIVFGIEKKIESGLLTGGLFDVTGIEQALLAATSQNMSTENGIAIGSLTPAEKALRYQMAPVLKPTDAYLNTGGQPISLEQYKGKDVVLVDFWTYSCINCLRTLPYLTTWYGKYKDQGLVVIGIHTPEFAFEHVQANVQDALTRLGITYPVLLDNEYQNWNAFGNQFWPHEYLIDIDGYIVHDHAGEGEYDVTEKAIQAALAERAQRLGLDVSAISTTTTAVVADDPTNVGSPETYFGAARNEYLGNGNPGKAGTQSFTLPMNPQLNHLYLDGTWDMEQEYAQTEGDAKIEYQYQGDGIYIVASAATPVTVTVLRDGKPVTADVAGADVDPATGTVTIQAQRLYRLVQDPTPGIHTLELIVHGAGLQAYTFTFG